MMFTQILRRQKKTQKNAALSSSCYRFLEALRSLAVLRGPLCSYAVNIDGFSLFNVALL